MLPEGNHRFTYSLGKGGVFMWLQFATSPIDDTKSYKRPFKTIIRHFRSYIDVGCQTYRRHLDLFQFLLDEEERGPPANWYGRMKEHPGNWKVRIHM